MAKKQTKTQKSISHITIVFRPETPAALQLAKKAAAWLKKKKITLTSHPEQIIDKSIPALDKKSLNKLDLVLVLGGDGTYLQAVQMLKGKRVPILGVNMGSLGFLTDIRKEDLFDALNLTLKNKMERRPRSMLEVEVLRMGKVEVTYNALNDVVIERGASSQLINIAIHSGGHFVNEVKADGLVVSTPTGSTAYNLAAAGPILHPHVKAVVVTPICPHALTHRPIIFPDDQALTFRVSKQMQTARLTADGQSGFELKAMDEVIISKSKHDHFVLKRPGQNYFDLLRQKLKFGER